MSLEEHEVYCKTLGSLKKTKKIQVLVWGIFMIFLWINVVDNYFTADFSKCSVWDGMLNWSIEVEGEEIIAVMLVGAARAFVFLFVIGAAGILAFLFCFAEYAVLRTAAKSADVFRRMSYFMMADLAARLITFAVCVATYADSQIWIVLVQLFWFASVFRLFAVIVLDRHIRALCAENGTEFSAKSGYIAVGIQIAALLLAIFFPWISIVLTLGFLEAIFKSVYYDKAEKAILACSEKVA